MNKIALSLCLFVLLCLSNYAFAEPYKDEKFPSLELLRKQTWKMPSSIPAELIGKFKNADGGYVLYYKTAEGGPMKMSLILLDTNIWIIDQALGCEGLPAVIQK